MASSLEYVQYCVEQLSGAGTITCRKMFGEYGLYCDGKYFACVCDNRLLVKITDAGRKLMPECGTDLPYEGGKPMFFIEDLENRELLEKLTLATCAALPCSKPKRRRKSRKEEA